MQTVMFEGKHTKANVMIDQVEESLSSKLVQLVNNEAFTNPIVMMPDCHDGKGAAIGFTMEMADNIIPNIVGVDQACGVLGYCVNTDYFDDLDKVKEDFNKLVRAAIPMGTDVHKKPVFDVEKNMPWGVISGVLAAFSAEFNKRYGTDYKPPEASYKQFLNWCKRVGCDSDYAERSIGTMGGGNHFLEVGREIETGKLWVFIHSGSRNLGKCSAEYWQKVAVRNLEKVDNDFHNRMIEKIKDNYPKEQWSKRILEYKSKIKISVHKELEPLFDKDMYDYLVDSIFSYHYACTNRIVMMNRVLEILGFPQFTEVIHTIHNYVDHKDFIIRKGAVGARDGEIFILPFNLEDGTLICKGKGNKEWNFSAPHGAGRLYSRSKAKQELNVVPVRERLNDKGIYASTLPLDELPEAYKPAAVIEEAIRPTAEIIYRVKPLINFKG